jgi:rhodanese-related sulfurtransferase
VLAESIKGALNVPAKDFDASLENGELSKLDRKSVVVAFGSRWPHYEIVTKLRGHNGFDIVYAMGGLEDWKAKGAPVERDEKLAQFLKVLEAEKPAPPPPPVALEPLASVNARSLKTLLDAGTDLTCIFVGDRRTYEDGHVPGAIHVPLATLDKWAADLDRNKTVVMICGCCMGDRGGPSELGVRQMEKLGFKRVLHLDGHMYAWKTAGLPIQTEDPPAKK